MGTIRDDMGTLVSALSQLVVGYFTVSPRSGILDVAATVRIELLWSSDTN